MEITEYYAIGAGAAIALFVLGFRAHSFIRLLRHAHDEKPAHRTTLGYFFFRHLYYSILPSWTSDSVIITRLEACLVLLFLAGNVCYASIRVGNLEVASQRLGQLALINLIPVCAGGHMNFIASICGIRYEYFARAHRWLGVIVILQITAHTVLPIVRTRKLELTGIDEIAGFVVRFLFPFLCKL